MALDLRNLYDDMIAHVDHEIVCVQYGEYFPFRMSVSLECETCSVSLLDANRRQNKW
jgi:hypothetical protein